MDFVWPETIVFAGCLFTKEVVAMHFWLQDSESKFRFNDLLKDHANRDVPLEYLFIILTLDKHFIYQDHGYQRDLYEELADCGEDWTNEGVAGARYHKLL